MLSGRRSGLNLMGVQTVGGLSLKGINNNIEFISNKPKNFLSQEYLDFKLLVIKNYIEPLMNKEYEYLKYNYHMVETTLENIKKYSNQNKQDIELFTKILKIIKNTIDLHISFTETEKKLYGIEGITQLLVRTSRIVLSAKYEIYNNLFGEPGIIEGARNYDSRLLDKIDDLLKTLEKPTFQNIRYEMRSDKDLFLSSEKAKLEKYIDEMM
tara:strand:- start:2761 stop:3393 length:633 start_codon:yes stop_codon:yes gene_type:complete